MDAGNAAPRWREYSVVDIGHFNILNRHLSIRTVAVLDDDIIGFHICGHQQQAVWIRRPAWSGKLLRYTCMDPIPVVHFLDAMKDVPQDKLGLRDRKGVMSRHEAFKVGSPILVDDDAAVVDTAILDNVNRQADEAAAVESTAHRLCLIKNVWPKSL